MKLKCRPRSTRIVIMRPLILTLIAAAVALTAAAQQRPLQGTTPARTYTGFDANEYPGDALLPRLHQQFAFTGFWLNNPPGADHNPWSGKRDVLLRNGFGFVVVFNGRLDKEILAAKKAGKSPAAFGRADAAAAVAAARREGFPPHTILFLDQEEGGRMLDEQAGYLLAWTEAVAGSSYRPGVYASGQPVDDGKDNRGRPVKITTIQDVRQQVAARHLHTVAVWIAQDACPPAPGCVVKANPPAPDASGTRNAEVWQYAQSPRRPEITHACAATYNRDGNCYPRDNTTFNIDLSSSTSPDPSHGR
jgi:hypothetical protein